MNLVIYLTNLCTGIQSDQKLVEMKRRLFKPDIVSKLVESAALYNFNWRVRQLRVEILGELAKFGILSSLPENSSNSIVTTLTRRLGDQDEDVRRSTVKVTTQLMKIRMLANFTVLHICSLLSSGSPENRNGDRRPALQNYRSASR